MTNFINNKLLVVGGTSGMGFETAKLIIAKGGKVIVTGSSKEKTEEALKKLNALGEAEGYTIDLTKQNEVSSFLKWIDENHSDINLLVNAAGVFFPKSFIDYNVADYDVYHEINKSFFFISQKIAQNLVKLNKQRSFVNIGSMWAKYNAPRKLYMMRFNHGCDKNKRIANFGESDAAQKFFSRV